MEPRNLAAILFLASLAVAPARRPAGPPVTRDSLGDVVLTVGSGEPRRLVACALGEPGFIVSGIQDDGYLPVVPDAGGPSVRSGPSPSRGRRWPSASADRFRGRS